MWEPKRMAARTGGSGDSNRSSISWRVSRCQSAISRQARPSSSSPPKSSTASGSRLMHAQVPSGAGCALSISACAKRSPAVSSSSGSSAGLTWANGKNAAPTSCTNPGSVSSADRTAPPGVALASSTSTLIPARARSIAATSPLGPDPITIASGSPRMGRDSLQRSRRELEAAEAGGHAEEEHHAVADAATGERRQDGEQHFAWAALVRFVVTNHQVDEREHEHRDPAHARYEDPRQRRADAVAVGAHGVLVLLPGADGFEQHQQKMVDAPPNPGPDEAAERVHAREENPVEDADADAHAGGSGTKSRDPTAHAREQ